MSQSGMSQKPWVFLTADVKREKQFQAELQTLTKGMPHVFEAWPVLWVDAKMPFWGPALDKVDTAGKTVILILEEGAHLPNPADLDRVDDLIVFPFRLAELISKVKAAHTRKANQELKHEVAVTYEQFSNAAQVLENILEAKSPRRFEGLKGLNVMSRHLTGLKPGGDYFDIFESEKREFVNILLCDSSSYGLSSALLGTLLSSSAKIASDANMNPSDWIHAIYQELKATLGEKEHLSLFFGRLYRRDFTLSYQLFGSVEAFLVGPDHAGQALEKTGGKITGQQLPGDGAQKKVHLSPKDRLVLMSDGFVKGSGGEFNLHQLFKNKQGQDPFRLVNELAFQIKSKLVPGETFPGEDCSAIVIDIEQNILRLAPVG
jgi:hypothetical protein